MTATDLTIGAMNAFDRAARENDIAAFNAASEERQKKRRARQAGAGEASCPQPEGAGGGGGPPGRPPTGVASGDDEEEPEKGRRFASRDPLVEALANAIEARYPGHVVGVNVPLRNASGQLVTDADILLRNAVIQVKSGSGAGLTSQLARTQSATKLPVIGYGPRLGGHLVRGIERSGGLVTRDRQLLIDLVAP